MSRVCKWCRNRLNNRILSFNNPDMTFNCLADGDCTSQILDNDGIVKRCIELFSEDLIKYLRKINYAKNGLD